MSKAAAGRNALILHTELWMAAGAMWDVKTEATAAGILQTLVWNQLEYGRAISFVVGRADWNPAFALAQMTVCRGRTAALTTRVFAKEQPHG